MEKRRVKVAALKKLGYQYVTANILINKAQKDFWKVEGKIAEGGKDDFVILRTIEDDEFPVEG